MGSNAIDLLGKKINFLTVLRKEKTVNGRSMWLCRCDCGNEIVVGGRHLYSKKTRTTKSCRSCLYKRITKHGKSNSQENKAWKDMKARCNNYKTTGYENYGGRGISYCAEWETFDVFYRDMGDAPSKKHSLDRVDVNGNYCKENCRWATKQQQARNQRTNIKITYKNETKILVEWSEFLGIKYGVLLYRIKNGWSIEDAFTTPVKQSKKKK